jgi:hypothetical protein
MRLKEGVVPDSNTGDQLIGISNGSYSKLEQENSEIYTLI